MHIQAVSPPSKDDLIRTMQSYGLPIYVTEIDVDLTGVPGTQKERFDLQAKLYSEALEACLESGVCDSFSFWDIGDHTSWLVVYGNKPNADATIFDKNFKPKPAYFALLEVLSEHLQP
jgi:GH35 family endo-1,4-beta-xylanase